MIKRAVLVIGLSLDSLEVTIQKRTRAKLKTRVSFEARPLHRVLNEL